MVCGACKIRVRVVKECENLLPLFASDRQDYAYARYSLTKAMIVWSDPDPDPNLRLRLHDNAGGENATKSFRIHGSFTRYAEQNVKVVHQNGRKPKRWPRWKNLKTEMFCRIN